MVHLAKRSSRTCQDFRELRLDVDSYSGMEFPYGRTDDHKEAECRTRGQGRQQDGRRDIGYRLHSGSAKENTTGSFCLVGCVLFRASSSTGSSRCRSFHQESWTGLGPIQKAVIDAHSAVMEILS